MPTGSSPPVRGTLTTDERRSLIGRFIPARAGNTAGRSPAASTEPVHPRPCGEHSSSAALRSARVGSSPPVRGTPAGVCVLRRDGRFIPARAGNTPTNPVCRHVSSVHPRPCGEHATDDVVALDQSGSSPPRAGNTLTSITGCRAGSVHPRPCGEHPNKSSLPSCMTGSSPPVRGTQVGRLPDALLDRFIPARAGNTAACLPPVLGDGVHPRPCGEHDPGAYGTHTWFGSSPPVRGTPSLAERVLEDAGFIPARAGNTTNSRRRRWPGSVHPRPCGEHSVFRDLTNSFIGSSPPVRGTPSKSAQLFLDSRFIPARAGNTALPSGSASIQAVHPRPCGEHQSTSDNAHYVNGSSPPVRGTPSPRTASSGIPRFIPARSGNTGRALRWARSPPVHPRPCGEHVTCLIRKESEAGSSPPVRGTQPGHLPRQVHRRFIPARAGNTWNARKAVRVSTVHPRPCGEHTRRHGLRRVGSGSSPPVRGTQPGHLPRQVHRRFIPARAGNTASPTRPPWGPPVHPRPCGEHSSGSTLHPRLFGSSPPVRGTPENVLRIPLPGRFIPARAGNTPFCPLTNVVFSVHPRPCGEHRRVQVLGVSTVGSSPPVRGTRQNRKHGKEALRFIPARAGNTARRLVAVPASAVHPRPCGEHANIQASDPTPTGSSPPVRGTHRRVRLVLRGPRFIPARAGNTYRPDHGANPPAVHPRPCGEHPSRVPLAVSEHGSSAPVRGTLPTPVCGTLGRRFIPARAGNTLASRPK